MEGYYHALIIVIFRELIVHDLLITQKSLQLLFNLCGSIYKGKMSIFYLNATLTATFPTFSFLSSIHHLICSHSLPFIHNIFFFFQ